MKSLKQIVEESLIVQESKNPTKIFHDWDHDKIPKEHSKQASDFWEHINGIYGLHSPHYGANNMKEKYSDGMIKDLQKAAKKATPSALHSALYDDHQIERDEFEPQNELTPVGKIAKQELLNRGYKPEHFNVGHMKTHPMYK